MRDEKFLFGLIATESGQAAQVYTKLLQQNRTGNDEWELHRLARNHKQLSGIAKRRLALFEPTLRRREPTIWEDLDKSSGTSLAKDRQTLKRLRDFEEQELAQCEHYITGSEFTRDGKQFLDSEVIPVLKDHIFKLERML